MPYADRVGRRRTYVAIYLGLAAAGAIVAAGAPYWLLLLVALTGLLSTDVVDNGPATTLEQAMLAAEDTGTATSAAGSSGARVYGVYNAVASLTGAFGALAAAVPSRLGASGGATWPFLVLVPIGVVGAALASRLSAAVEPAAEEPAAVEPGAADGDAPPTAEDAAKQPRRGWSALGPSRARVRRLAALFAVDAAGGGMVTASFLAYYLDAKYDVTVGRARCPVLYDLPAAGRVGVDSPRLADRVGLVPTMVFTHLPSNVLLAAAAFALDLRCRRCPAAGPHLPCRRWTCRPVRRS